MKRNIYLNSIDLIDANQLIIDKFKHIKLETEFISVKDGNHRIPVHPIFAYISSPHYNASAMDGIAVKSEETASADDTNPVLLKKNVNYIIVDTGDVIPDPFDSVIKIEEVMTIDDETVEIISAAYPWQDVRPVGEDIVMGEMIVPPYQKIRPVDIGALLAGGVSEIEVLKPLKVGIIPTGTEIVEIGQELKPGDIIDSNTFMMKALLEDDGVVAKRYDIVIDDEKKLKEALQKAVDENDMVLTSAGSSAGTEDFTSRIVESLGKLYIHGVNTRPGKPVIIGEISGKPIVGMPGYPGSAYLAYDLYVRKIIELLYGMGEPRKTIQKAVLSKRIMSSVKSDEFVRVKLGVVDGKMIATPLNRGAGVTMSLVRADGYLIIPKSIEGVDGGTEVDIVIMRTDKSFEHTAVSIGSHDMMLDHMNHLMATYYPSFSLSSAHVGSFGGVMALKRKECHIAPVHLLNEKNGNYNTFLIERYFKDKTVTLVEGIKRIQGLIVEKGNPKNIHTIQDLEREDLIMVNRQKGSGTRVLLDYLLSKNKINSDSIKGYKREMTTHMTIATAVSSGTADVGVGIESAAVMMGLDFIPLGEECYDFLIETESLECDSVKHFIEILKSDEFKQLLSESPGYAFETPGRIIE